MMEYSSLGVSDMSCKKIGSSSSWAAAECRAEKKSALNLGDHVHKYKHYVARICNHLDKDLCSNEEEKKAVHKNEGQIIFVVPVQN